MRGVMTNSFSKPTQVRVFFGFQLPLDLKLLLVQNRAWKSALFEEASEKLEIVRHERKEYIGRHLVGNMFTLKTLHSEEKKMRDKLAGYVPDYSLERLIPILFPSIFIG